MGDNRTDSCKDSKRWPMSLLHVSWVSCEIQCLIFDIKLHMIWCVSCVWTPEFEINCIQNMETFGSK